MTIEAAFNYPSDLNASYPAAGDAHSEGDDHIRGVKNVIKTTLPNVTGAITLTHTEINNRAPLASPTFTGTPAAPTASASTSTTQIATTAFVQQELSAATGRWVKLQSQSASSSSSIDFVNGSGGAVLSSTYDEYIIALIDVLPASDAALWIRTSTNGGSSYDAAGTDYVYSFSGATSSGAIAGGSTGAAQIVVANFDFESTGSGICGEVLTWKPATATARRLMWRVSGQAASGTDELFASGCGRRATTADIDAIRFLFSGGVNIASGTFILYGRKK